MSNQYSFNPLDHPILFAAPATLSGLSTWVQHIPFAMLLIDLAKPDTFVELGTHRGDSYFGFCQAVKELKLPTRCWAIDTWTGDAHTRSYGPDVLTWVRSQHDPVYNSFSTLVQSTFDAARAMFIDGQVDLLHIDGLHTYQAVRHDFETWLPAMSRRGIVLFHDTRARQRDFGVWKLWEEIAPKYPSFEFHHGFGLGILAVGAEVPRPFMEFLQFANDNAVMIRNVFSALGQRAECYRRSVAIARMLFQLSTRFKATFDAENKQWPLRVDLPFIYQNVDTYALDMAAQVQALLQEHVELKKQVIQLKRQS